MLAATYLRSGRTAQAVEVLEPALARAPDDPALLRAAAEVPALGQQSGEGRGALRARERARQGQRREPRPARAGAARRRRRRGAALRELETLAGANPTLAAADLALVSAHLRRRETDQALAAADAFAKKQPSNPLAWNVKGVVYTSEARLRRRARELRPGAQGRSRLRRGGVQPGPARPRAAQRGRRAQGLRADPRQGSAQRAGTARDRERARRDARSGRGG